VINFLFAMKTKYSIKLLLSLLWIGCILAGSGCWSAHPHSAYRAIHQYAINGDASGVAAELANNPNGVNLPEDDGLTPLHLAAENCHSNVVVLLLERGAKINATDKDKATPLHLAAQEGCSDVVTVLLEHGAKINARDDNNRTPLLRAEQWHQEDVVLLLKKRGGTE
jgi:ankyrin repeat protein